jgi:hypothetical protein
VEEYPSACTDHNAGVGGTVPAYHDSSDGKETFRQIKLQTLAGKVKAFVSVSLPCNSDIEFWLTTQIIELELGTDRRQEDITAFWKGVRRVRTCLGCAEDAVSLHTAAPIQPAEQRAPEGRSVLARPCRHDIPYHAKRHRRRRDSTEAGSPPAALTLSAISRLG